MDGLPTQERVDAFAYDPNNPKIMFAGLREGIFVSKNEGREWALLKDSPKGMRVILLPPKNSEKIFVGAGDGRVFISNDRGRTWKLQNR